MKEAIFYEKLEDKRVHCRLCPHNCVIAEGKLGVCSVRKNISGKLYSLVYGRPVAVHIDPIEKKPLFHFYPGSKIFSVGTFGCNLSCQFCQNYEMSQAKDIKRFEDAAEKVSYTAPEEIVRMCKDAGLKFLAFTYNEPTIFYEYMLDIAKLCKKNGIKTVSVSNGQINEKPLKKLLPCIDAFNIDLKAFNEKFYKEICNGSLEAAKRTIELILKAKKHLEVTFLLIESYNDDEDEFNELCSYLSKLDKNIVLHISRAFSYYQLKINLTPAELLNKFEKIAKRHLKNVYVGNI